MTGIAHLALSPDDYDALIASPFADEIIVGADVAAPGVALLLVDGGGSSGSVAVPTLRDPGTLPVVVCWVGDELGGIGPPAADVVVGPGDVEALVSAVAGHPLAARTLAVLLRTLPGVTIEHGLALESAAYSVLQSGPEFAAWRADLRPAAVVDDGPVVRAVRIADRLEVVLDRPARHNAITAQLRDELVAALAPALVDDSIERVVLRGAGPSFCSGGDLHEFGSRPDPASAHVTRLARSPARVVHLLRSRTTVLVHGATLGGGIELASFAGQVIADPATTIGLPEIGLGLIPGAGGTVGLTARIGRQRTAALALTGRRIGATTAFEWGLVDAVDDVDPPR